MIKSIGKKYKEAKRIQVKREKTMKTKSITFRKLTSEEKRILIDKDTEPPFSGKYNDFFETGTYHCKRCNTPLFHSEDKIKTSCGWPSFDDEIPNAIKRTPDPDGRRTEIQCARCNAHLGHVFQGEGFSKKNARHCVNSLSLTFVPNNKKNDKANAYFAGGCFWGLEYYFTKVEGVISVMSGYMGGQKKNPSYGNVSTGKTGHLETVQVTYNPSKVSFKKLAKFFFEIHDPTQSSGQGPDIGEQYTSAIFYQTEEEKKIVLRLIDTLKKKGYDVQTKVLFASRFWEAEEYHQHYYERHNKKPYCHKYQRRF